MNPLRSRSTWLLGLVAVIGGVASIAWAYQSNLHTLIGETPAADPPENHGVVCFGHVDVEHGVTRLGVAQAGRIRRLHAREGQTVEAQAELLSLDDHLQQSQLTQARQALQAEVGRREQAALAVRAREIERRMQQAALESNQDRQGRVQRELARCEQDFKGMASNRLLDELKDKVRDLELALRLDADKLDLLQIQIDAAKHDRDQAASAIAAKEELVKQAERAAADCVLKAPFAGQVLRVRARPGELVGPASPEPLIELCPNQPRLVRAEVAQEFAGSIRPGTACVVNDEYDAAGPSWRGKVLKVSDWFAPKRSMLLEPFQHNDARTLECLIELSDGVNDGPGDIARPRIGQRMRVVIGR